MEVDGKRATKDMGLNDLAATIEDLLAPPMIKTTNIVPRMYIIHKADWLWLPILFYKFGQNDIIVCQYFPLLMWGTLGQWHLAIDHQNKKPCCPHSTSKTDIKCQSRHQRLSKNEEEPANTGVDPKLLLSRQA